MVELELQLNFFSKKKKLKIDSTGITYDNKYLPFSEIKAARYGAIIYNSYGINGRKNYTFEFDAPKKMKIVTSSTMLSKKRLSLNEEKNTQLIDALWKYYFSGVVNSMINTLNHGESVRVGNFEVNPKGVTIYYWSFFKQKTALIPWSECLKGNGPGYLYIKSSKNKRLISKSRYLATWNLNAFQSLLNYLWENGNCYKLERGEKI